MEAVRNQKKITLIQFPSGIQNELIFNESDGFEMFQAQIFSLTGIDIEKQNLNCNGKQVKNDLDLLNMKGNILSVSENQSKSSKPQTPLEELVSTLAPDQLVVVLETLQTYITNILNTNEAKFRTINSKNANFQNRLGKHNAAIKILLEIGFQKTNEQYVLSESLEGIIKMRDYQKNISEIQSKSPKQSTMPRQEPPKQLPIEPEQNYFGSSEVELFFQNAILNQNWKVLETLLESRHSLLASKMLIYAVIHRKGEVVKYLLDNNVNPNVVHLNLSALWAAAHDGNLAMAKLLTSSPSINIDLQVDGAFYEACEKNHLEVAQHLYSCGAKIDLKDKTGRTPFLRACTLGHLNIVKYLHSIKCNIYTKDHSGWFNGLQMACYGGHVEVAKFLISIGLDPTDKANIYVAAQKDEVELVKYLISLGCNPFSRITIESPFYSACSKGSMECVRYLYSIGCEPDVFLEDDPLFLACIQNGCLEVVKFLVSIGININVTHRSIGPIERAEQSNHPEIADFLRSVFKSPGKFQPRKNDPLEAILRPLELMQYLKKFQDEQITVSNLKDFNDSDFTQMGLSKAERLRLLSEIQQNTSSNIIPCWIYFQGESREFAKSLQNSMVSTGKLKCGIDEDFRTAFPGHSNISDCVAASIRSLINSKGIAIIIFNKNFFKDGQKGDFNPMDEFLFLMNAYKLGTLSILPIWHGVEIDEVVVPPGLQQMYNSVKSLLGHIVNVSDPNVSKIVGDVANRLQILQKKNSTQ